MKMLKTFTTVLLCFSFAACSANRIAAGIMGNVSMKGIPAIEGETDVQYARESALPMMKILEVTRESKPRDFNMLQMLARAYGQYAFGFLEEDLLRASPDNVNAIYDRTANFYRRGMEYGIAALSRKKSIKKSFNSSLSEFKLALSHMGKRYVAALFWTAFDWAGWLNLNRDDPAAIVNVPRIEAILQRVLQLDASYYHGSAHVLLATIYASRPAILGGDSKMAKSEFDKAFDVDPDYLMTKVIFAQYYARQIHDRALFEETLKNVKKYKGVSSPDAGLGNALAKRRAKILLLKVDKLF